MCIYNKKMLGIIALATFTPIVLANGDGYFKKPYVGFEIIQTNQQYKDSFGNNVFKKNPQNYSFFVGFNFWEALGFELGYELQPRRSSNNVALPEGSIILGIAAADNVTLNSYTENLDPYLGLFADTDKSIGSGKMNLKALIGFSVTTVKANCRFTKIGSDPENFPNNFKKTKSVFLAKLSSSYTFANNVGIRLSLNYRNIAQFKINSNQNEDLKIRLKNMFGIGLGLTYYFL